MADDTVLRKLDPHGRRQLMQGMPEAGLGVIVRMDRDRSQEWRQAVDRSGLEVHSNVGDLITGHVASRECLERLLDLQFVREVQISRPLYHEPDRE